MNIGLFSSQHHTTQAVLSLKTRPHKSSSSFHPEQSLWCWSEVFQRNSCSKRDPYIKTYHGAFRILLGKMSVGKKKSNEVMSTGRTSLRSPKPSPPCTLSVPSSLFLGIARVTEFLAQATVHSVRLLAIAAAQPRHPCASPAPRAAPKLQLPCSRTMPGQLRLHLS